MLNIFTIALHERDNILAQYDILKQLTIPWRWSIVIGYAKPLKDTAWCHDVKLLPDDGTIEVCYGLAHGDPRIVVNGGAVEWPGKTAMVNAALDALCEDQRSVLLQLDADEYWAPWQLEKIHEILTTQPFEGIRFRARMWVGPNRVACGFNTYGNMAWDWYRAWSWNGVSRFKTHEPPTFEGENINKFVNPDMALNYLGLMFEHRAYVTEKQVRFKEEYYGYKDLLRKWSDLNSKRGPVFVQNVFGNHIPFLSVEA